MASACKQHILISAIDPVVTGAVVDNDGRIWLIIDATEQSDDCIDCDYCGIEVSKGVMCIDNREKACFPCFNAIAGD